MKTYPAVRDPGSIELLFRNVRSKEEPDKITSDYLASIGFRRQTDVKLLELLFFLGFIDNNLSPTAQWKAIRDVADEKFKEILSPSIEKAYASAFQYQEEQGSTDSKLLMAFFKKETGVTETESAYMVLTLQVLTDLADFHRNDKQTKATPAIPAPDTNDIPAAPKAELPDVSEEPAPGISGLSGELSLNITIPASAMDAEMLAMIKTILKKTM